MMKVRREALIKFFDTDRERNRSHSSSINAVCGEDLALGLLGHYFKNCESATDCVNLSANKDIGVPRRKGNTGRRGNWLDSWFLVITKNEQTLYQIEIKSWSAHSLDGKELALGPNDRSVSDFKIKRWNKRWDAKNCKFLQDSVNKVLLTMDNRPPMYQNIALLPLVCFWEALSPEGKDKPFFEVTAKQNGGDIQVNVFSLSSYLRTLAGDKLELDLPNIHQRLGVLGAIFSI